MTRVEGSHFDSSRGVGFAREFVTRVSNVVTLVFWVVVFFGVWKAFTDVSSIFCTTRNESMVFDARFISLSS